MQLPSDLEERWKVCTVKAIIKERSNILSACIDNDQIMQFTYKSIIPPSFVRSTNTNI